MRKGFVCPDGTLKTFEECLRDGGCPSRCISRSSLKLMAIARPWTGKPSTTQLINGTMMEYLKIKHDYYENPQHNSYAILGTRVHGGLASTDDEISILEEKLEDDVSSGTLDFLEHENNIGVLGDHKVCGFYKVLRARGFFSQDVEAGEYKTGPKKGKPKFEKQWFQGKPDCFEWTMQLNRYRMLVEKAGFKVDKMKIEATIRDFNSSPREKGRYILKPIEYFEVEKWSDDFVQTFFNQKNKDLLFALENGWKIPCSERERWNDRRCEKYCSVAKFCPHGIIVLDKIVKV
jgi:hypothetical protein